MTATELTAMYFGRRFARHDRVIVMHPDPRQRKAIATLLRVDRTADILQFDDVSDARQVLGTSVVSLIVTVALFEASTVFQLLDAIVESRQSPRIVIVAKLQGQMKTAIRAYGMAKRVYEIVFADDALTVESNRLGVAQRVDPVPALAPCPRASISKGDLHEAFESGAIQAVMQPQYCLKTATLVGAEMLARWCHPSGRVLSPDVFLPLVSRCDWDLKLVDAMLGAVSKVQKGMARIGCHTPLKLAINVSAKAVESAAWAEGLAALVELHGLNNTLVLEITEDGDDGCTNRLAGAVGHWRLKGFDCAIDDFGKGGSSYRRLRTVPFNVLKLDCTLLWEARQAKDRKRALSARTKLRSMVDLAHSMDMVTIAEGIETPEDYDLARKIGCDIGQGYLLSKPLSIDTFIAGLPA